MSNQEEPQEKALEENQEAVTKQFGNLVTEVIKKLHNQLFLFVIGETALLILLLVLGSKFASEVSSIYSALVYAIATIPILVIVGHIGLEFKKLPQRQKTPAPNEATAIVAPRKFYECSDSSEFRAYAEKLILNAKNTTLIGTGLNILHREPFLDKVMTRASKGECILNIYLADPFSPAIESRLIEEELGEIIPSVAKKGLISRLKTLLTAWENLGRPKNIDIRLFTQYPTFALLIIDDIYLLYPYGYAKLGNYSPVLPFYNEVPSDKCVINFLIDHHKRVKRDSLDAGRVLELFLRRGMVTNSEEYPSFALYYIPPEDSPLFQFGSKVLGYDVRSGERPSSPWADKVGNASKFGFHLTLCDVLYFQNEAELRKALKEIEFILDDFKAFDLCNLEVEEGIPDSKTLSVTITDPSGQLEALHHELVNRIYRCAAGSDYSFGLAKMDRDLDIDRARLMVERYRAPYIFHRFKPHFTLLTQLESAAKAQILKEVDELFEEMVSEKTIHVNKIAVMTRSSLNAQWTIKKEIHL